MKKILVTGGAGFIGSHLVKHLLKMYPNYIIVNVDSLTYASNYKFIKDIEDNSNYSFYKLDINETETINNLFQKYNFDTVINLAAESHVDNSIIKPGIFAKTNILGTINLLNIANQSWSGSNDSKNIFYQISTDEVYGSLGIKGSFTEKNRYSPRSPYSASKASADHFVYAYSHTYNLPVLLSNCSNNFGPNQHEEKLIPKVVSCLINKSKIPVYGNGSNIRDWLFVEDHISAIDLILHNGKNGESYNIGGGNELSNLDLVKQIIRIFHSNKEILDFNEYIDFVDDRKGHDFRYSIDYTKLKNDLGWTPKADFFLSLQKTINWYRNKK
jgi:dTDP-glucose 4,6-dehydratase